MRSVQCCSNPILIYKPSRAAVRYSVNPHLLKSYRLLCRGQATIAHRSDAQTTSVSSTEALCRTTPPCRTDAGPNIQLDLLSFYFDLLLHQNKSSVPELRTVIVLRLGARIWDIIPKRRRLRHARKEAFMLRLGSG